MVVMLGKLTFSLTAPVMAPACVLFFVGNFVVWRYHVLYVYERGYESNGSGAAGTPPSSSSCGASSSRRASRAASCS